MTEVLTKETIEQLLAKREFRGRYSEGAMAFARDVERVTLEASCHAELIDILGKTLSSIESMACDFSAYYMTVENPDHPWHDIVMPIRAVLEKVK